MNKLLLKTWRDIKIRKGQFIALIVLVALGITSYVAFISGYQNLSVSVEHANKELKFANFSTKIISAPKAVISEIEAIRGVKAVQGRLIIDTVLPLDDEKEATARVISIPTRRRPKVNDVLIEEGVYPDRDGKNLGLIHKQFAEDVGIKTGDILTIKVNGEKKRIKVAGIAGSPEYMFPIRGKGEIPTPGEFAVVFMTEKDVGKLFNRSGAYNDISILLYENTNRDRVIEKVEDILEPFQIIETVKQEDQPSNFSIHEEMRQNQALAYFMPLLILIISSLTLFIALSRLVQSQRGEIGLAKALGYKNWQILVHYLLFSLFIALTGSAIGFALGQIFAIETTKLYISMLGVPFLRHQIYPQLILGSILLSSISCITAGLVPAYISARMRPAIAMRSDPNVILAKGKTPILERIISTVFPLSFTFKIPLRNVFRARRRSLYTIIGIAFAMVLTIATWSLFDSMDYLMDHQFNDVENWDILAVFDRNFSSSRLNTVDVWKGVNQVQGALMLPAKIEANGKKHEGAINAIEPGANFHGFDIIKGDDPETALRNDGLILPPVLAKKLEVDVGDDLNIKTPFIKERQKVRLLALSDEMVGTSIFTSINQGKKLVNSTSVVYNSLYLHVDRREAEEIRKKLHDLPGAISILVKGKLIAMLEELMQFGYVFYAILLVFGLAMAFVVIYNTFTANILERTREIATMRTIGEDRSHLATTVTLENLFLALAGIPIGIALGIQATNALYKSLSSEAFTLKAVIYPDSYLWIVLLILLVLLMSEIPPIRRIFRLDLAQATKAIE